MSRTHRRPKPDEWERVRGESQRGADLARVRATAPGAFCVGKIAYPTKNDATHAGNQYARYKGKPAVPYKCPACPHYHLTTGT